MRLRILLSALAVHAVAVGTVAVGGCGDDGRDSTGGARVVLHTRVTLAEGEAAGFVTPLGWTVVLSHARVATGPFYYYDSEPPVLATTPPMPPPGLAPLLVGLGVAHAHPGHFATGNALGEMLEPSRADLLSGPVAYPDGHGVTGRYRSASFGFGATPDAVERHLVDVVGTAELEGQNTRHFSAFVDFAELQVWTTGIVEVAGCVLDEVEVGGDGTVTVSVRPSVWFEEVDFALVEPGTPEAPVPFVAGTATKLAFAKGLAQHAAYHFSFSR